MSIRAGMSMRMRASGWVWIWLEVRHHVHSDKAFHSLFMMVSFVASLSLTQVQYHGTVSRIVSKKAFCFGNQVILSSMPPFSQIITFEIGVLLQS